MSKQVIQNALNELIESVQGLAIATLKEDGCTSNDCQLQGLLQALNKASYQVNGIQDSDIRALSEAQLTENDRDSGYPLENLLLNRSLLSEKAESMVNQALYARTDFANMARLSG